jgi:large subunit ribosomal protein L15
MAAPVRSRRRREGVKPLKINSDPQKLDQMYLRFLGKDGDKMLQDETKWLAVTHKSFDHGRRGFNDRLCFLGLSDFLSRHQVTAHG